MSDPVLARWPQRRDSGLPVARETRTRDAATAAALEAYLTAGREVPTRSEIRL